MNKEYIAPPIELLKEPDEANLHNGMIDSEKIATLENVLEVWGVPMKVLSVINGKTVTRYELDAPSGMPIKRIERYVADISYVMNCCAPLRIEAPISGRRAVAIEIPNEERAILVLREGIASKAFQNAVSPLALVLGQDVTGRDIVCNLNKAQHLLMGGYTGSGKTACIKSMIISLLYKASPDDVRMILVDLKGVEYTVFNGLPHLLGGKVLRTQQQAMNALNWLEEELERRIQLLADSMVTDIDNYNKREEIFCGQENKLPHIVFIVDEISELMLCNQKRAIIEDKMYVILSRARNVGIHFILSSQHPSVNVITGTIKANIPSRIAFATTSNVNSRIILDESGAEKLMGEGDMLYSPVYSYEPTRIQGAFVSDKEILSVVDFVRSANPAHFDVDFGEAD